MIKTNVGTPSEPELYTKLYNQFKGVDYSTDPSRVDDNHSPDAENLISDMAGFPEKRVGWRVLWPMSGNVNGLYYVVFASGQAFHLAHVGTKLYTWGDTTAPVEIFDGLADVRMGQFTHRGKWYILDGVKYRVVMHDELTGFIVEDVEDNPYVPTVAVGIIGSAIVPEEVIDTSYEEPNLLTTRRKAKMVGDGSSKVFMLTEEEIDAVVGIEADGTELEKTAYSVDAATGAITFTTAPAAANPAGESNVTVEYTKLPDKDDPKWAGNINHCTICVQYGYFNDNRIFLAGDADREFQNVDYMSASDDPTYFPRDGWVRVGSDASRIMGYLKQYDALAILKSDDNQDAQIYLRTSEYKETTQTTQFPVRQGVNGIGVVSKHAVGMIGDDPVFLSRSGVYGIACDEISQNRSVQLRSKLINAKLCRVSGMDSAISVKWGNYWILCIGGKCYVADGQQKNDVKSTAEYGYEWYYWTNIPARCFYEENGSLYFGTADGRICKFNTDIENDTVTKFSDAGEAIRAKWTTRMDLLDTQARLKTMTKKGCTVLLKPYTRSSVDIAIKTNRTTQTTVKSHNADILDFADVQFERISFNAFDAPDAVPIGTKVKKFVLIQIVCVNNVKGEGFGVYGIQIQYVIGNYIK